MLANAGDPGVDFPQPMMQKAVTALDALVARVTDLQERYDVLAATVKGTAFDVVAQKVDAEIKLARAEARITDLEAQVRDVAQLAQGYEAAQRMEQERAEAAEARVVALTRDLESAEGHWEFHKRRAQAAEAQVETLTQERDEYRESASYHRENYALEKARAEAAEAALKNVLEQYVEPNVVADLREDLEAAEAALATTRQALAEISEYEGPRIGRIRWKEIQAIARRALAETDDQK